MRSAVSGEWGPSPAAGTALRLADVDQARWVGTAAYHPHDLDILGDPTRFALGIDTVRVGALTVGWISYDTSVRVRGTEPPSAYQVNVPVFGRLLTWCGAERIVASCRQAAVYRVDRCHGFEGWDSPCRTFGLRIERHYLEQRLSTMLGHTVRSGVAFDLPLDIARGPGRHWWALVQALTAQVRDADALPKNPLLVAHLEHSVTTGLLLAAGHDHRAVLAEPVPSARPGAVRRAVEYIESHPERPMTVIEIADTVGVGVRTLQEGFRVAHDTTPMRYLRQVRLARARRDLLAADGDAATVAQIAYRWGFSHLGRFGAEYRRAYGEPPSETLARPR